jgi:hypothetical protein
LKITIAGIIICSLSLLLLFISIRSIQKDRLGIRSGLIWIMLWFSIGFFSIFPEFLNNAMQIVQMKNRFIFIMFIAILILLALLFNLTNRIDFLQRNLIKLAREIAVINYKVENQGSENKKEK